MTKYHVNPMGDVHPCSAIKQCRFGLTEKQHFDNKEDAQKNYETEMSKVSKNVFAGLKKNAFTDQDRVDRANSNTVALQIESKVGKDALAEAFEKETKLRGVSVSYMNQSMGEPVVGLAYGGDYKAEEEYGSSEIAGFLGQGKDQANNVTKFEKDGKTIYSFGNPAATFGRFSQQDVERSSDNALKRSEQGEDSLGEFQSGKALTIITSDPVETAVLDKMVEAAQNNSLRVGSTSNPFGRGIMFYDERDLSVGAQRELAAQKEWSKEELEKVQPIRDKFKDSGQRIYALSRPTLGFTSLVGGRETDPNETYYWLNSGSVRDLGNKQAFGWYNTAELEQMASGDWSVAKRENS